MGQAGSRVAAPLPRPAYVVRCVVHADLPGGGPVDDEITYAYQECVEAMVWLAWTRLMRTSPMYCRGVCIDVGLTTRDSNLIFSRNRLMGPLLDMVTTMTQLTCVRAGRCVWVVPQPSL